MSQSNEQRHRKVANRGPLSNEQKPQTTISSLFATLERLPKRPEGVESQALSPNKRPKLLHSDLRKDTVSRKIAPTEMYTFSPSTTKCNHDPNVPRKASEVIDLTESPGDEPFKLSPTSRKSTGHVRRTNLKPQGGPKKLVVKNLKKTSQTDPEQYYNHVWGQLEAALSAIFIDGPMPYSFEELYRGVESLCRQDRASAVYKQLREKCRHNVSVRVLEPLVHHDPSAKPVDVLDIVVKAWLTWTSHLTTVRSIFFYLDRSYLLQSPTLGSIEEMGIELFRTHAYSNNAINPKLLQGTYDLLSIDRQYGLEGDTRKLLIDASKMFHALAVYTKDLEPKLVGDSEDYLLSWAESTSSSLDLAYYVDECQKLMDRETRRCETFALDRTTRDTLEMHMEDILVERKQDMLLDTTDISTLLGDNAYGSLEQLYSLLCRRRLGDKLRPPFEAYILKIGSEIVFDEQREQEMVPRLLEFKRKLDHVWSTCFQKHVGLGHTLREAFEAFINKSKRSSMTWGTDNPKPGEMIAKYVDMILKGGSKAISTVTPAKDEFKYGHNRKDNEESSMDEESEISVELDQVLELFRFVHGKAVFEAFYKRDLARRLLLARSASADAEKKMLTRLKSECGAGFTHNLEQMFKDIELAREEISSYRAMLEERQTKPAVDLNVNVLSASAWPSYPDIAVEIPQAIQGAMAGFESHYKNKHTGRRLAWKHGLAHCQLKSSFPKGNKEIVVSAFQAIVLLHFNDKEANEAVPYAEIQAASNLNDTELKRTLQSLACAKYQVLRKSPKGRDVNSTDMFMVNQNFDDPKYRIKINQIQAKETKQENKETHERVAADRNFETQAAIVRIMKSCKKITHAELISEVIVATRSRGVLDPSDIKKNIERLIEKDYMERDETNDGRNAYSYLA